MNTKFKTAAQFVIRQSIFVLPVCIILFSAFTPPAKNSARKRGGQIEFENATLKFGEVEPGKAYVKKVTFTNTGTAPVRIYKVEGSCGAYVPEFPTKPIKPNETAVIKVVYQPREGSGNFHKSIIIESNSANGHDYLYLQGTVITKTAAK